MINEFDDEEAQSILSNQWAFGQLFPELMSPGPMPKDQKHKTHTFSSKFSDTVSVWGATSSDPNTNALVTIPERKGKMWVYFAPLNDLLNLSVPTPIGADQDIMSKNAIFYASSNGPMPSNTFTSLHYQEITMNGTARRNLLLTGYKKIRVISAALVIKQIGPIKERSGILKIGMGYKGAMENISNIVYDKFENYFSLNQIVYLNEKAETICRFRLPEHLLETYAPFDPTTSLPYFFIYGEGISTKISFEIDVVRHFEGLILPEYSSFHPTDLQPVQSSLNIQNELVRAVENQNNTIQSVSNPGIKDKNFSYQHIIQQSVSHPTNHIKQKGKMSWYNAVARKLGIGIQNISHKYRKERDKRVKQMVIQMITNTLANNLSNNSKENIKQLKDFVESVYDPKLSDKDNILKIMDAVADKFVGISYDLITDKILKVLNV